jgi:hypothetical protein
MSGTVAMTNRIDIGDPVAEICRRLGLEPADVAELRIRPREVIATVHLRNDEGRKYVIPGPDAPPPHRTVGATDPDVEVVPATETHTFEVTT